MIKLSWESKISPVTGRCWHASHGDWRYTISVAGSGIFHSTILNAVTAEQELWTSADLPGAMNTCNSRAGYFDLGSESQEDYKEAYERVSQHEAELGKKLNERNREIAELKDEIERLKNANKAEGAGECRYLWCSVFSGASQVIVYGGESDWIVQYARTTNSSWRRWFANRDDAENFAREVAVRPYEGRQIFTDPKAVDRVQNQLRDAFKRVLGGDSPKPTQDTPEQPKAPQDANGEPQQAICGRATVTLKNGAVYIVKDATLFSDGRFEGFGRLHRVNLQPALQTSVRKSIDLKSVSRSEYWIDFEASFT